MQRSYNRSITQLRPVRLLNNIFDYSDGSLFLEIGKTRVICSVTINEGVPHFLKGKQQGWLTASYAMLPASTKTRIEREVTTKRNERSVEISRLIGRSLRGILNMSALGERTIHVDCDVLQADGGTRSACITAASIALQEAQVRWLQKGLIKQECMLEEIAAISVGLIGDTCLVDLDFVEDSSIDADFNFVFTRSGNLLEVQGSAEKKPVSWQSIQMMHDCAWKATQELFDACKVLSYTHEQMSPAIEKLYNCV